MNALSTDVTLKRDFKGKGARMWLDTCERDYLKIVAEMVELADRVKSTGGNNYYVIVNRREFNEQVSLRWRAYGFKTHRHVKWESMQYTLSRVGSDMREWYESIEEKMRLLNAQEKACRYSIKLARKLVDGGSVD